jgi:hypothetical protein
MASFRKTKNGYEGREFGPPRLHQEECKYVGRLLMPLVSLGKVMSQVIQCLVIKAL